jgi:hypothetical protein
MPSDSGVTSSSSQSSPSARLPASRLAWIAAVRVDIGVRDGLEEFRHCPAHVRHARRAADHHHAVDVFDARVGVAHRLADRIHRLADQMLRDLDELGGRDRHLHQLARLQDRLDRCFFVRRQQFLGLAGLDHQRRGVLVRQRRQARLFHDPAEQAMVEIVAAQGRIAAGRQHFEHAFGQLEDRDVEGATAQVIHGVHAFLALVEAIRDGGGGRLGQQAQDVQAGQLGRILGGLTLCIVEVGRHRDDGAHEVVAQRIFGALAQRGQNLGRDFDGAFHAGDGIQLDHALAIDEVVRQVFCMRDVFEATAHEALDRDDRVLRVGRLVRARLVADVGVAIIQVVHDRRQQRAALLVAEHFRAAAANGGDERIGGAQVDAYGQAVLVRGGGHAGFGDLEECHSRDTSVIFACRGRCGRYFTRPSGIAGRGRHRRPR